MVSTESVQSAEGRSRLTALKPVRLREVNEHPCASVLVVDDEPLIRWAIAEQLSDAGYSVQETGDARGAMSALAASAFDVVLLDIRLPDSNDLTLLTCIRQLAPAARVIMMTAHGTRELAERAVALGAFGFLDKPFELREMAGLVAQAIGN
jgi:DNA-binding NtrC family response regulator